MKESTNLIALKQSNTLVSICVDASMHEVYLNESFYSIAKQTEKPDVLVLCPSDTSDADLSKIEAIIKSPTINLVEKDEKGQPISKEDKAEEPINYTIVKIDDEGFGAIFNTVYRTAKSNDYEFFMIVEHDDVLAFNWIKTALSFAEEDSNTSIFFPLIRFIESGTFSKYMNEATWAEGFAEEAGKADINLLNRFNCLNILGALLRVSDLDEYRLEKKEEDSLMKDNIGIGHYYEFFLRMIYNDIKTLTVPRVGYELRMSPQESFNHNSTKIPSNITVIPKEKGGISGEHAKYNMDSAKKEYFFDYQRDTKPYQYPNEQQEA